VLSITKSRTRLAWYMNRSPKSRTLATSTPRVKRYSMVQYVCHAHLTATTHQNMFCWILPVHPLRRKADRPEILRHQPPERPCVGSSGPDRVKRRLSEGAARPGECPSRFHVDFTQDSRDDILNQEGAVHVEGRDQHASRSHDDGTRVQPCHLAAGTSTAKPWYTETLILHQIHPRSSLSLSLSLSLTHRSSAR
jgi:hypothetical protein